MIWPFNKKHFDPIIEKWLITSMVVQWIPYLEYPLIKNIETYIWKNNIGNHENYPDYRSIDAWINCCKKMYKKENQIFIVLSLTRIK